MFDLKALAYGEVLEAALCFLNDNDTADNQEEPNALP